MTRNRKIKMQDWPYDRYTRAHKHKVAHSTLASAISHWIYATWAYRRQRTRFNIYACRWTDQYRKGATAPRHYHIGRARKGRVIRLKDGTLHERSK